MSGDIGGAALSITLAMPRICMRNSTHGVSVVSPGTTDIMGLLENLRVEIRAVGYRSSEKRELTTKSSHLSSRFKAIAHDRPPTL